MTDMEQITYWFVVTKFAYLRTPQYRVAQHNSVGGSFCNWSGNSLKKAAGHMYTSYRNVFLANPATRVILETVEGFDENDNPVVTSELTDMDAFLSRMGVTRSV